MRDLRLCEGEEISDDLRVMSLAGGGWREEVEVKGRDGLSEWKVNLVCCMAGASVCTTCIAGTYSETNGSTFTMGGHGKTKEQKHSYQGEVGPVGVEG